MTTWATIVALAMGALVYAGDTFSILVGLAELGGVVALFAFICVAEAFSEPRNPDRTNPS